MTQKYLVDGLYPNLFSDIVGQLQAKKRLSHYLVQYTKTHQVPNLLITAPKGQGKTRIAREVGKGLIEFNDDGTMKISDNTNLPKRKNFKEINCSTLGSVSDFCDFLIREVQDKNITLFFDEASEIPHDIGQALLTILQPNVRQTSFTFDNQTINFDFIKQSFIFATSEPNKIYHALKDRFKRVDLEDYTPVEIEAIVQVGSKGVKYENGVLSEIASVSRGNARSAQDYAFEVKTYIGKDDGNFNLKDWKTLKDILSIAPLGLNSTEIIVLKYLADSPSGTSLTCLSAKTGLTRSSLQRDYEIYLMKHSMIQIENGIGRTITPKGLLYLKVLKSM